jgi:hypothetical protein
MTDLTKLTIKELYQEMDELNQQLSIELSMDGSGELGGKIIEHFEPFFDRIEKEIESRPKEELDQYWPDEDVAPWDKDDTDPAGGSGLASHV